ncbi:MAG: hypothetical protein ACYDHP_01775 [Ferrimicrobium sp.]
MTGELRVVEDIKDTCGDRMTARLCESIGEILYVMVRTEGLMDDDDGTPDSVRWGDSGSTIADLSRR